MSLEDDKKTMSTVRVKLRFLVPAFATRVAPLYYALAWEWGEPAPHIPQPEEIRETLYSLIDSLGEGCVENGTGGLVAWYIPPTKTRLGSCGLRFTVEEEDEIISLT